MMANVVYTPEQVNDAKELAAVLLNAPAQKRPIFALMVECMLIGAELVEKQQTGKEFSNGQ